MKTYIVNGHHEISGVQLRHGDEAPSLIDGEVRDWWLDHRWLIEYDSSERRSLYRLFSAFSGCTETEPLDSELKQFAI
jgi:hypothetical protein